MKEKMYRGTGECGNVEFDLCGSKNGEELLGDANVARGELAGEAVSVISRGAHAAYGLPVEDMVPAAGEGNLIAVQDPQRH